jgi:hypothetical protein
VAVISDNKLYDRVVDVTREYLGPAADRFIARQIASHLQKQPEELTKADMSKLINWLKLSMAFLTDDERLIARYVEELQLAARTYKRVEGIPVADGQS